MVSAVKADKTILNTEPYATTGKAHRCFTSWIHAQHHTLQTGLGTGLHQSAVSTPQYNLRLKCAD